MQGNSQSFSCKITMSVNLEIVVLDFNAAKSDAVVFGLVASCRDLTQWCIHYFFYCWEKT